MLIKIKIEKIDKLYFQRTNYTYYIDRQYIIVDLIINRWTFT